MTYPLYTEHAHLWPLLAPLESYEEEMSEWVEILTRELGEQDLQILDLGTGGGHHLYHLFHQLPQLRSGLAVDLAPEILSRAQALLPKVSVRQADMTELTLGQTFPLISVHDSFCYLCSLSQVQKLFQVIFSHLDEGGIALVKVDAVKDSFEGPYRYLTNFEEDDFDITLTHYEWDPVESDSTLEVLYHFIQAEGTTLQTREEIHQLGIFQKKELVELAAVCQLEACWHELQRWDEERENLLLLLRHRAR